jgi:hypothetical protein
VKIRQLIENSAAQGGAGLPTRASECRGGIESIVMPETMVSLDEAISGLKTCDICHTEKLLEYVDGKTIMGPWANMCLPCWARYSRSHGAFGTGLGQLYYYRSQERAYEKVMG